MKRIMSEKKTTWLFLRGQDWKIVEDETEKNNRLINKYLREEHHRIKFVE